MTDTTIALVTGANRGLGLETSRQLAQRNILVLMGARRPAHGHAAADRLKSEGLPVEPVQLDVTRPDHIAQVKTFVTAVKHLAYDASKAALNQFTVHLAAALKQTPIKVNAAHPGWVRTDIGSQRAPMGVKEGAATAVRLATLTADGPSGKFLHVDDEIPW